MINFILFLLILFSLILFLWASSNLVSVLNGCLYAQTDISSVKKVLKLFAKKNLNFTELGSGNGDVLIEANRLGMKAKGYEISPFYFLLSKLKTLFNKKIKIEFRDFRHINLNKADIIYCYLNPKILEKLSFKFKKELKKGSILISAGFPIPNLTEIETKKIKNRTYFIYKN